MKWSHGGCLNAQNRALTGTDSASIAASNARQEGAAGLLAAPYLGTQWITYPVGIAAGWLFYLGYHAVHEETKRRGVGVAGAAALAGIAGAAVILRGAEMWLR